MADPQPYLDRVTSEHQPRPKFMAMMTALLQPLVDQTELAAGLPQRYDLDVAVGAQEDVVGQWVGRSRFLTEPIDDVYFSFDIARLGFNRGTWKGPFDPVTGIVALPDDAYRQLLRAKIAGNFWDGTVPDAYRAWGILFAGQPAQVLIQDNQDMTMLLAFWGRLPDKLTLALLTGGYLGLRPAGVGVNYMAPTVIETPFFGFDVANRYVNGFDHGAWGNLDLANLIMLAVLTDDSGQTILVDDQGNIITV